MATVTPDSVLEQLWWRAAVKKFDQSRKIPADTWAKLQQAMALAPSSYGFQPWKFLIIEDPELRKKLRTVSYDQPQVTEAPHFIVLCRRMTMNESDVDRLIKRTMEVRKQSTEELAGTRQAMLGTVQRMTDPANWAARSTYIALGFLLVSAAMMGIDVGPMEGFQPEKYDEILNLKSSGYGAIVIAAAGYRSPEDSWSKMAKVRYPVEQVFERR